MDFFSRQILLWGQEAQDNLTQKSIAIIGAGGLGSSLAYSLSALGLKEIFIIDYDQVSSSNIHRQIMFEAKDEGRFKAEVFKKLEKRYDKTKISPKIMHAKQYFSQNPKLDLLLDASDNLKTRLEIDEFAKSQNIPWVWASVEGFLAQACLFKDKSPSFYPKANDNKPGQNPSMVMFSAAFASLLALKFLLGLKPKTDHFYYFDFLGEALSLQDFEIS